MAGGEKQKTIVLGVTGGIACYKAAELVRLLIQDNFAVRVIMTKAAAEFVTPLTFQTLSGYPVATDLFSLTQESEIGHINLADQADLLVIAPATANIVGKIANGIADDLLTTVVLATTTGVLLVPAMNVHMYQNRVVQENLKKLRDRGYHSMEPAEGYLACGYEGRGRLPEPEEIVEQVHVLLEKKDLAGEKILITAGPNQEPIDPIRYLSNRSSGKMGYALAQVGLRRGAEVTLVSGPTALKPPAQARLVSVMTAAEMRAAVLGEFARATAVIMAAAVADFSPAHYVKQKIKRENEALELSLKPNPDILRELGTMKKHQVLIGFAAETDDLIANAGRKLQEKNLDLIVANDVTQEGSGFDVDTNAVTILDRGGGVHALRLMSKHELAGRIYDFFPSLKGNGISHRA